MGTELVKSCYSLMVLSQQDLRLVGSGVSPEFSVCLFQSGTLCDDLLKSVANC